SIVARPNQPASQRSFGEGGDMACFANGSPREVARNSPGQGDVPYGGRPERVIQHRAPLVQFLADDRDSRRIVLEAATAGSREGFELRPPARAIEESPTAVARDVRATSL